MPPNEQGGGMGPTFGIILTIARALRRRFI